MYIGSSAGKESACSAGQFLPPAPGTSFHRCSLYSCYLESPFSLSKDSISLDNNSWSMVIVVNGCGMSLKYRVCSWTLYCVEPHRHFFLIHSHATCLGVTGSGCFEWEKWELGRYIWWWE